MTALALRCELLTGVYQAADPFGAAGDPEWPPHPYRLHAALVAAACELGGEEPDRADVETLTWLECQGAPAITHTGAVVREAPVAYVPRNPVGVEFTRARDQSRKSGRFVSPWQRNGRRFPAVVPEQPVITYEWPTVPGIPARLERLVGGVSWLGSSRSPIACALIGDPPPATLVPGAGNRSLRVAGPGITDALLDCRHDWPTRAQAPLASYSNREERAPATPVAEALGALLVKRLERTRLDLRFAGVVCAALRSAVLCHAGDHAPSTLHGHGDSAHTAYLALGDVGRPHATGLMAGVALAIPPGLDPETRRACTQAFEAVEVLKLGPGMRSLSLSDDVGAVFALRPERWARPACSFATVTPVVLDRFPRNGRTEEDELAKSLVNAGFTEKLLHIDVLAGPAVRGGVLVSDLQGEIPPGRRVHARIEFAKPVRGPLLAGRGRFRGIGLFLPSA